MFAYLASFDASQLTGTIDLSTAAHGTFAVVPLNTISTGAIAGGGTVKVFNHYTNGLGLTAGRDKAGTAMLATKYSGQSWAAAVQTKLRAQATADGWGADANSIVVTYSTAIQRYTISYAPASLTVTFTGDAAALFGYNGNLSGGTSYLAPNLPYYAFVPSLTSVSMTSTTEGIDYEPESISSQSISGQGVIFGMSRGVTPLCRDWTQQFESKANTLRASATVFTHQGLFETVRADKAFVVVDNFTGFSEVFFLRGDSCNFGRDVYEMAALAYDQSYHVKYRTWFMGRI